MKKLAALTQLGLAQAYVSQGDEERARHCCNNALLLLHDDKAPAEGLTLYQLNAACDAFLDKLEKYYKAPAIPVQVHVMLHERKDFIARSSPRWGM